MTTRLGIIGYPIKHSMSPAFQNAAIKHHGLDMSYEAWEVPITGAKEFVAEVRTPQSNILGFNVMVPHKEMVMEYVDELSPEAKRAQAVNTIMKRDGRLLTGVAPSLKEKWEWQCSSAYSTLLALLGVPAGGE
jgi:shikimate dehydrogenase